MTQPPSTRRPSGEAESRNAPSQHAGGLHKWMMTACLVLMGVAMLIVLWRGNPFGVGTWLLLLPMGLCLGVHLFVHRLGHRHDE
jgi:hypothetical protein